jgi:hypothetical protein
MKIALLSFVIAFAGNSLASKIETRFVDEGGDEGR